KSWREPFLPATEKSGRRIERKEAGSGARATSKQGSESAFAVTSAPTRWETISVWSGASGRAIPDDGDRRTRPMSTGTIPSGPRSPGTCRSIQRPGRRSLKVGLPRKARNGLNSMSADCRTWSLSSSCPTARGDSLAASGMLAPPLVRRRCPTTPRGLAVLPLSRRPPHARYGHDSDSLRRRSSRTGLHFGAGDHARAVSRRVSGLLERRAPLFSSDDRSLPKRPRTIHRVLAGGVREHAGGADFAR